MRAKRERGHGARDGDCSRGPRPRSPLIDLAGSSSGEVCARVSVVCRGTFFNKLTIIHLHARAHFFLRPPSSRLFLTGCPASTLLFFRRFVARISARSISYIRIRFLPAFSLTLYSRWLRALYFFIPANAPRSDLISASNLSMFLALTGLVRHNILSTPPKKTSTFHIASSRRLLLFAKMQRKRSIIHELSQKLKRFESLRRK